MNRRLALLTASMALASLAGCRVIAPTQIIVQVETDLRGPGDPDPEFDRIEVRVLRVPAGALDREVVPEYPVPNDCVDTRGTVARNGHSLIQTDCRRFCAGDCDHVLTLPGVPLQLGVLPGSPEAIGPQFQFEAEALLGMAVVVRASDFGVFETNRTQVVSLFLPADDTGPPDAGAPDAGASDAGAPDAGVDACVCSPGAVSAPIVCGRCGTQTQVCNPDCTWGPYGACSGEGLCPPTMTDSRPCGPCGRGRQTRTCRSDCTWGSYGTCAGDVSCSEPSGCPGDTGYSSLGCPSGCARRCTCSSSGAWGTCAACPSPC